MCKVCLGCALGSTEYTMCVDLDLVVIVVSSATLPELFPSPTLKSLAMLSPQAPGSHPSDLFDNYLYTFLIPCFVLLAACVDYIFHILQHHNSGPVNVHHFLLHRHPPLLYVLNTTPLHDFSRSLHPPPPSFFFYPLPRV